MSQISDIKNQYISHFNVFEEHLNGESKLPIHNLRKEAIETFGTLQFPTLKDEEWKYTNISSLIKNSFSPIFSNIKVEKNEIEKYRFENLNEYMMVFVNGIYNEELSGGKDLPKGVIAQSLKKAAIENNKYLNEHLAQYVKSGFNIFSALNTAFIKDGAFVYIPENVVVETPIHILFISSGKNEKVLSQPRNLFIAGKNSQATIVEHYAGFDESEYFTNTVTEVVTEENSFLDHIKYQEESLNAFHIAVMEVNQKRYSNFTSHAVTFGGKISRNDFNARFADENSESTLNGLFLIDGEQLFDTHTIIDHAKPHCNSHEHYKGILKGKSRGVFNGKIYVRKDAQKTNAFQENNNLILSDEALMNAKPQLEIFADDVKCSHGATVGQLNEDSMFYLKARGIGEDAAKALLIYAFASDVIKSIKVNPIRKYVEHILQERFLD